MPLTVVQFEYAWEIHVYLRLAGIYYTEENRNYPISVLEGKRAYLIDGPYIVNEDHALQYLRENYTDIDLDYSEVERSEISVYSYLLQTIGTVLYNKRKWCVWENAKNMIKNVYKPILSFPYNLYYGLSTINEVKKQTKAFEKAVPLSDDEMVEMIDRVYAFVEQKLASQKQPDFIFGGSPSTLDVLVISYLIRLHESNLDHLIQSYPLVVDYYDRMIHAFFSPDEINENTQLSSNEFLKVANPSFQIECSLKSRCYVQRKNPYEEEKEEEESEEEKMMKEEEERLAQTKKWRIGLFSVLAGIGIGIYLASEMSSTESSFSK